MSDSAEWSRAAASTHWPQRFGYRTRLRSPPPEETAYKLTYELPMPIKVVDRRRPSMDPKISHDLPLAQIVTNPGETPGPSFSHPPDRCTCPKPEITPILWSRVATTSLAAFLGNDARFYMTARFSHVQPQSTPNQSPIFSENRLNFQVKTYSLPLTTIFQTPTALS